MSNIPKARDLLSALKKDLQETGDGDNVSRVEEVLGLMTRKSAPRVSPRRMHPMTGEQWDTVKHLARTTTRSQHEIAVVTDMNIGRVSEVLSGQRARPQL